MVKSTIKTVHEESYSDGRTLGVLVNLSSDNPDEKINSFTYLFREEGKIYVIFETLVELNDYLLYGDKKVKRAYIKEDEFDQLYDNPINGHFENKLKWVNN